MTMLVFISIGVFAPLYELPTVGGMVARTVLALLIVYVCWVTSHLWENRARNAEGPPRLPAEGDGRSDEAAVGVGRSRGRLT